MIRRRSYETKIHHERWLVSYSDFITLLFAFFVVMYSVSQVNDEKYEQLSSTLGAAFSAKWPTVPSVENIGPGGNVVALDQAAQQIEKQLSALAGQQEIRITKGESWIEVALQAKLLFPSGSAELGESAEEVLEPVVEIVGPYDNAVAVEGHTDDIPISNEQFSNNWELSSARAVSVVNFLAFQGVEPSRLSAIAFGEHKPVADNESQEGRERNRRVVLRISNKGVEQSSVPAVQAPLRPSADQTPQPGVTTAPESGPDQPTPSASIVPTPVVAPVRLQSGGLLFSSDPDLPRNNAPVVPVETDALENNPAEEDDGADTVQEQGSQEESQGPSQ